MTPIISGDITVFGWIGFVNFVMCATVGVFLLIKNVKSPANVACATFQFCIAFFSYFYFMWQTAVTEELRILFFKWCIFGVVLINTAFVQFVFVRLDLFGRFKKAVFAIHLINAYFCFAALTSFYKGWEVKFTYGLWPVPSLVFHVYLIWWFAQVFLCFCLLYRYGIKKSSPIHRHENQWIFWSTLIAYTGGATNWLVWYGVNFPPYFNSTIAIYAIILAFAVVRYRVFDIDSLTAAFHQERLIALGILAASINHEVKNPLFLVRGLVERLREKAADDDRPIADGIIQQLDRIFEIIKNLSYFARYSRTNPAEDHAANLPQALRAVFGFIDFEFKQNGIKLIREVEENLPLVQCEQQQLEGILFNIMVNACHAMEGGGELRVKVFSQNKTVCAQICDTGPGINGKFQKEMFKPFYSTKGEKGLGLGLYITKRIVESNDGQIEVRSTINKGTTFNLSFKAVYI